MRALCEEIWVHERAWMGVRHALRTTIVRMRDGRLFVHSPVALDPELRPAVDALGEVGWLVAANNHHHRWLLQWHEAYPRAEVFVSPAIPAKRRALQRYSVLNAAPSPPWREELAQAFMAGVPFFSETVFLHRATGSMIVTDLVQNHTDPAFENWPARMASSIFATLGFEGVCLAPPLRMRWLWRDPPAFGRFLAEVASWPVQRIIVTHGRVVERDAREQFTHLLCPLQDRVRRRCGVT